LGVFAFSFYWITKGIVFAYVGLREHRQHSVRGVIGGLTWLVFFVIRNLYGWRAAIGLALILALGFSVTLLALGLLSQRAGETGIGALTAEDYALWAVSFLFIGISGAWLYFLLFAPFGVLCALSLRACGHSP
jgi:hypothetical protein